GENPSPLTDHALDIDRTPVLLYNLVSDKKPEPCAGSLGREEGVKDLFFVFGRDAFPCVLDLKRAVLVSIRSAQQRGCDCNSPASVGRLQRIQYEIHEDLFNLLWVSRKRW